MKRRAGRTLILVTAVVLISAVLPAGIAAAKTIVKATPGHGTYATAEVVPLTPDLVLNEVLPNSTLADAQPVSPTYYATTVTGAISKTLPGVFFAFQFAGGANIQLAVESGKPATQFPELLLYDPNGNLVAIAAGNAPDRSGSIIDFTANATGRWTAEITSIATKPAAKYFRYSLRVNPAPYTTDLHGYYATTPGFYAISTHNGDDLHLAVESATPATKFTELFLYDNSGDLVAVAAGNAPDRSGSIIDFTIPTAGTWYAEVAGPPFRPKASSTHFKYDLAIQGETGAGPVKPK